MRRQFRSVIVFVGFAALLSETAKADEPTEIPFKLHRQHIFVKGSIGDLDKLNLLIDTGAAVTTVDGRVVKKLGLETETLEVPSLFGPAQKVEETELREIQLGPIRIPAVQALVTDLSNVNQGKRTDLIVGLDILRQFKLTIDYRSGKLLLGESERLESTARFSSIVPFLTVVLKVEGQPLTLMLDTGAEASILFEDRIKGRLPKLRLMRIETVHHVQGTRFSKEVQLPEVSLGTTVWKRIPAVVVSDQAPPGLEIDGLLSLSSLGATRVQFDFVNGTLGWQL